MDDRDDDQGNDRDDDQAAIIAVIRSETEAWLRRDLEALAAHWVQSPTTRRMESFASLGVRVDEGWDVIIARIRKIMERFPDKQEFTERVRWEKVNIVVDGNTAWMTYDQIGSDTGEDRKRQLRILHRIDGTWKIACLVMMESSVEEATWPLIEIDAERRIRWTNRLARERLPDHPGLVDAAGRLRTRRRDRDAALSAAVGMAFHELESQRPLSVAPKQAWAVALGDDAEGVPVHCWVLLEDGKTFVSFDYPATIARRIADPQDVYALSPAQASLARLIVEGADVASAADTLAVSVNTVRTQLQRIFDKTGARSQAALIRTLLSAQPPHQ